MQVLGLGSGRPRWVSATIPMKEIHTRGSGMVVYRGFRFVFKIERPSGHDLISSGESKRSNDSTREDCEWSGHCGLRYRDRSPKKGVVRVESGLRGREEPRVQDPHGRS